MCVSDTKYPLELRKQEWSRLTQDLQKSPRKSPKLLIILLELKKY